MVKEKIVILGAGESGIGTAILAKKQGFEVFVSDQGAIGDSTKDNFDQLEIDWEENTHTISKMEGANYVMKSPGIPSNVPFMDVLRDLQIPIISEIEFASKYTDATLIGITGSNGKTTTAMLTHHILKSAGFDVGLAGNIGNSFAKEVAEKNHKYYVLEISSFQLDDIINFAPQIGVITNITPDHLDRYDYDFTQYLKSKLRINQNQTKRDFLLFNADDPELKNAIDQIDTEATLHGFGYSSQNMNITYMENDQVVIKTKKQKTMINTMDFTLKGRHNLLNAMAASTVADLLEVSKETIRESLSNFKGAPHRLEQVLKIQKINYINDSKATNINSVYFALESMNSQTVWIVGGVDKGNDYEALYPLVREKVKAIVCLGLDNQKIIESFQPIVDIIVETQSMKEAVLIAHKIAEKSENVLLSPACASFDLFENYEDRGNQFKQAVREL
ncbi:MAG: UDP-N-acetylmuramoyl-L-alanine--D-glutamate ligase [Flavobacteriales bacterium MED-G15]|nr:MAG: UDP-N-acetylmuramoyl-L-alanine--D-glutamate ligase [Flavobacteriales bacterium MED-G15]